MPLSICSKYTIDEGPSWMWSYGSWIYNYLCNIVAISLIPTHGEVYSIQLYVIKYKVSGFLRLLQLPPPIKLIATIYSWNIVESGIKHHNPYPNTNPTMDDILCLKRSSLRNLLSTKAYILYLNSPSLTRSNLDYFLSNSYGHIKRQHID